MSSTETLEKYSYRRTFAVSRTAEMSWDPSRPEFQTYINELLGVKKDSKADRLSTS